MWKIPNKAANDQHFRKTIGRKKQKGRIKPISLTPNTNRKRMKIEGEKYTTPVRT